jgi:hypothetical protein
MGWRSLHVTARDAAALLCPLKRMSPPRLPVWLDAMARSLRAGAYAGRNAWLMRGGTCGVASWRTGLIDLNPRLDPRHASGGDCLMTWERIAQRVLKEPLVAS